MAKTDLYKNLIDNISLLDEYFSRVVILGQVTTLKEGVDVINISGLKDRAEELCSFVDIVIDDIISRPENYNATDIDYLLKRADESLQQCNSHIVGILKRLKDMKDDEALTSSRTFVALTVYKDCLEKIVNKLNYISVE